MRSSGPALGGAQDGLPARVRSALLGAGMQRRLGSRLGALDLPAHPSDPSPVTEDDVRPLPTAAQRYLRFMGVVGRPRDWSLRARWTGHFRLRPGQGWQPFEAWQYNSGPAVARVWVMRIDLAGVLPVYGADTYVAGRGRMRGTVLGLVPVADGAGPEFDIGELVTWLDDAVLLAPGMLLVPAVTWSAVDDDSFDVMVTDRGTTVGARVSVDGRGRVLDVSTTDRFWAASTGLVRTRWTTPVPGWSTAGGRPVLTGVSAVWHLPEGPYEYARARVDLRSLAWNVPPSAIRAR